MSVKVKQIGDRITVPNPALPGQVTEMVLVTFIEEGRSGANKSLSDSSSALDAALGISGAEGSGLDNIRTHTQPVKPHVAADLRLGQEIPGLHINRQLFSSAQMAQQEDKAPRMINGRPTYFTTSLDATIKEDEDFRLSIDLTASFSPDKLFSAQTRVADVKREANPNGGMASAEQLGHPSNATQQRQTA